MIIDGRALAEDILTAVAKTAAELSYAPKLGVVTCEPGPETRQYLELKKAKGKAVGIEVIVLELPKIATTADCIASVNRLAEDTHGVIVQLPLPTHIEREQVLDAIPVTKDPDGFAYGCDERALLPPVPGAIAEIARLHNVAFTGQKVTVVGDGRLVGSPTARFAQAAGADVTLLNESSRDYEAAIAAADIIISGVGQPHFIQPEMVKDGVVVFDAGASEDSGEIVGDVHPEVAHKAKLFTPVPGGIGPLTVAVLLRNLITLTQAS